MHNHILRTPKKKKTTHSTQTINSIIPWKITHIQKKKKKPRISVKFQDHRKVSVYEYREREREREMYIHGQSVWGERHRPWRTRGGTRLSHFSQSPFSAASGSCCCFCRGVPPTTLQDVSVWERERKEELEILEIRVLMFQWGLRYYLFVPQLKPYIPFMPSLLFLFKPKINK